MLNTNGPKQNVQNFQKNKRQHKKAKIFQTISDETVFVFYSSVSIQGIPILSQGNLLAETVDIG